MGNREFLGGRQYRCSRRYGILNRHGQGHGLQEMEGDGSGGLLVFVHFDQLVLVLAAFLFAEILIGGAAAFAAGLLFAIR